MSKARAAKAAPAKAAGAKAGGSVGLWILCFLMLVLAILVMPSSMLLAIGMVPTFVSYVMDTDARKTAAVSVGMLNICGVVPFEIMLWQGNGDTMPHAMQILGQIETWAAMYGAAAIGSVIYYSIPPIIGGMIAYRSQMRVHDLERRQAVLREAWGDEVGK